MVGIVLVGHKPVATALKQAAEMIFGPQAQLYALNLDSETSLETYTAQVRALVQQADEGDGVLIMVDLFGGSPATAAAEAMEDGAVVVTGANLPMLLEVLGNAGALLPDLLDIACEAGSSSVVCLNHHLHGRN